MRINNSDRHPEIGNYVKRFASEAKPSYLISICASQYIRQNNSLMLFSAIKLSGQFNSAVNI